MVQYDSPGLAKDYADKALARMTELGLVPYPNNFSVWYGYYTGRDPDLVTAVDAVLASGEGLDDNGCTTIYEKFLGTREKEDALYTTSAHIEAAVDRILGQVDSVNTNIEGYTKTLSGYSHELASGATAEQVHGVVTNIVAATRRMEERNQELQRQLDESSDEVTELKANLEQVQAEALKDGLTGIANRRGLDEELRNRAIDAIEEDSPLSLLMIDIDHFKNFNDRFGHLMGDQVLKLVAQSLVRSVKGRDYPARFGGEEFAVLLPGTPLSAACVVANQICQLIGSKNVVKKATGEVLCKITVSIGVGEYDFGEPLDMLVRRADEALYEAKRSGRNRVTAAEPMVEDAARIALS